MNSKIFIFTLFVGTAIGFHHGGFQQGGKPHFSPFAGLERNLTDDQRDQVQEVFKNENLTKQQVEDNLKQLFDGFGLSTQVSLTERIVLY